jgi:predicted DCC family thiol-disulfide oxidoreductase YuxK
MVYDGDCDFCNRWIKRWRRRTGDHVDYVPFQSPELATRFPEIPSQMFEASVQLIVPDGSVFDGAEAVFRSLALSGRSTWALRYYQRSRIFARAAERFYRFVARHRKFFSAMTPL